MASAFRDPLNPEQSLPTGCSCGRHASQDAHDRTIALDDQEALAARLVETVVVKAVFGADATRRSFLRTVGTSTALAALSQFFFRSTPPRRPSPRRPARSRRRTSRSASSRSPAPRRSSWPTRWASIPKTCSTPKSFAPPAGQSSATKP